MSDPSVATRKMSIDTNLSAERSKGKAVASNLIKVLADTYNLYITTRYTHWGVRSIEFFYLQNLFEAQYEGLARAVDDTATRLRDLGYRVPGFGFRAPGSVDGVAARSNLESRKSVDIKAMILELVGLHQATVDTCRECLQSATEAMDQETEAYMAVRLMEHEKTINVLDSLLR